MIIAVDEMIRSALRMRLRERLMEKHGEKPSVISVKITSSLPDDHNSNCLNYLSGIAKAEPIKTGAGDFSEKSLIHDSHNEHRRNENHNMLHGSYGK